MKVIAITMDQYQKISTDEILPTFISTDYKRGGGTVWSLDEKMGQTYVHKECANTLAQRDYKQPQAVIYELSREDRTIDGE